MLFCCWSSILLLSSKDGDGLFTERVTLSSLGTEDVELLRAANEDEIEMSSNAGVGVVDKDALFLPSLLFITTETDVTTLDPRTLRDVSESNSSLVDSIAGEDEGNGDGNGDFDDDDDDEDDGVDRGHGDGDSTIGQPATW